MRKFYKKSDFFLIILILVAVASILVAHKLVDIKDKVSSVPQAANFQELPLVDEVHSPDGKMKAVIKKTTQMENNLYTFTVSDINGGNARVIFTAALPVGEEMKIPANSFSPDNKYLFFKKTEIGKATFLAFKTNGEEFSDKKTYIDVGALFSLKIKDSDLDNVTGWDADNLLHVYTLSQNGRGPSYWFNIDSRSFLILANR